MSLFEILKRTRASADSHEFKDGAESLLFRMQEEQGKGIYLELVDHSGKIVEASARQYSGVVRTIIQSIEQINDQNSFTINWENPEQRIYLHEHEYLIPLLLQSGKLVTADLAPVKEGKTFAQFQLCVEEISDGRKSGKIVLEAGENRYEDFQPISETFSYVPELKTVFEHKPVGALFHSLNLFSEPNIPEGDLQKYLSLFFSYTTNIALQYQDYEVKRNMEPINAKPVLIFEKVDADDSLYMRIGQVLPNTDIDFLDNYDLLNFALINEIEQIISVHPVAQLSVDYYTSAIEKRLKKYKSRGKKKEPYSVIIEDDLMIIPGKIASEFIYKDIPELLLTYTLIGAEKLKDYKINVHPPRLKVQLGHGIDFLEGSATLDFGEESISLLDALSQFKKNRYVVLSDGSHALINEQYMQRLQRLFKKKEGKVQVSFFDLPLVEDLIEENVEGNQFPQVRKIFDGFNTLAGTALKLPKIEAKLRPYQEQGFKWLRYLYENNLGGCLADDMGLGKTLQAITLLSYVYQKEPEALPTLIVMPRSLLFNWSAELKKFAPHLSFYIWHGNQRSQEDAENAKLILTTYGTLRSDIEHWKDIPFLYAILDESQAAKNLQSQLHKAIMLLKAAHRLALSGTPVENNLSELYALFRFLNPAMFGNAENFNQNYLTPIQKSHDPDAIKELRKKIYPFILRRLKKDVLKDLPSKIEQTLYVEMSEAQARLYEAKRKYYKQAIEQQVAMKGIHQTQFFVFQAMSELRQIASIPQNIDPRVSSSPKAELLIENVIEAVANKHKVLIFANYIAAVEQIGEALDKQGIDFITMTGSTRNRQQLVERFQNDPECKVFVLTLKTGGVGLNLTAADMVFIFDPWWNKSAENQAIDRAHRIGQQKSVSSYKLITLGTIEEKMLQLQELKSELFESLVSSDGASLKSMTEEDIQFILGQ